MSLTRGLGAGNFMRLMLKLVVLTAILALSACASIEVEVPASQRVTYMPGDIWFATDFARDAQ
jgi:hypothetical protein